MNIKQLETFFWAARLGSFVGAAERMNATQSTISMRIQELEQDLGAKLFDRSHRSARLTAKGAELLSYAERIIDISNELRSHVSGASSISGLLRIGVVEIVAFTWMPRLIADMGLKFPKIDVSLEVDLASNVASRLREGHLDIILAPRHLGGPNFTAASLGSVQFRWVAHPSITADRQDMIDQQDSLQMASRWPLIVMCRNSHHYTTIEKWLQDSAVVPSKVYTCNSLLSVRDLTVQGVGIGFLPPECFPDEFSQGLLKVMDTTTDFEPVEYFVTTPINEYQAISRPVAELAVELSTFGGK